MVRLVKAVVWLSLVSGAGCSSPSTTEVYAPEESPEVIYASDEICHDAGDLSTGTKDPAERCELDAGP